MMVDMTPVITIDTVKCMKKPTVNISQRLIRLLDDRDKYTWIDTRMQ